MAAPQWLHHAPQKIAAFVTRRVPDSCFVSAWRGRMATMRARHQHTSPQGSVREGDGCLWQPKAAIMPAWRQVGLQQRQGSRSAQQLAQMLVRSQLQLKAATHLCSNSRLLLQACSQLGRQLLGLRSRGLPRPGFWRDLPDRCLSLQWHADLTTLDWNNKQHDAATNLRICVQGLGDDCEGQVLGAGYLLCSLVRCHPFAPLHHLRPSASAAASGRYAAADQSAGQQGLTSESDVDLSVLRSTRTVSAGFVPTPCSTRMQGRSLASHHWRKMLASGEPLRSAL